MQSDTYFIETDSEDENSDYTSDSSSDLPINNNRGTQYKYIGGDDRFMDQSLIKDYNQIHRKLFSKQLTQGELIIQSRTYQTTSSFNSSNYTAKFDELKNVIGIQLKLANIRVPQYNVNTTNNIIKYKVGSTEYSVTINPGSYTVNELAAVFSVKHSISPNKTHKVTYSSGAPEFTSVVYHPANTTIASISGETGMKFEFVNGSEIEFLWSKDNITKGACRLFGFYPIDSSSAKLIHYSDKPPDLSQHYIDLVIPEIPGIACKRSIFNNGRLDIIDRIHLTQPRGEYVCYKPDNYVENYFTPIRLSQLTIQLYSDNNVEFDSQNTDNNFTFEITVLGA